jgi:hypothetical protein
LTGDTVAAAASLVAVGLPVVLDTAVDNVLEGAALLELGALMAPYAIRRSSLLSKAGSRSLLGQPDALHGFDLQQPRKVLPAVHV